LTQCDHHRILAMLGGDLNARKEFSGGHRRFLEISRQWKKAGIEIVGIEFYPALARFARTNHIAIEVLPVQLPVAHLALYSNVAQLSLKSLALLKKGFNLVWDPGTSKSANMATFVLQTLTRAPIIMTFHHCDHELWKKKLGQLFLAYRKLGYHIAGALLSALDQRIVVEAFRRADAIFTVSEFSAKQLGLIGVDRSKIVVTGCGIRENQIGPSVRAKLYDGLYVGRMDPKKGIFDLLTIWTQVVSKKHTARLIVVGKSSPSVGMFLRTIRNLGLLKNIDYRGWIPDKELEATIESSRVFVFPTHIEGWGISIAEAMAKGLPVVTYDIEPLNQLFPSDGVCFVAFPDVYKFADTILKILSDEALQQEMGRKNITFARRYLWRDVAQKEMSAMKYLIRIGKWK